MIPRAKKNIHECEFHLSNMRAAKHFEDLEISFAAFVNSARNVTFVLEKEFRNHPQYKERFLTWYGYGHSPEPKTKCYEMQNDELCQFFNRLRNQIVKEGINGLVGNTQIKKLDTRLDLTDKPPNSSTQITGQGIYYLIHIGTAQEDKIPSRTKGVVRTSIFVPNAPDVHLGNETVHNNIFDLSELYFTYLKNLVEEWTGIINTTQ